MRLDWDYAEDFYSPGFDAEIEHLDDYKTNLHFALAGFTPEQVKVSQNGQNLFVEGETTGRGANRNQRFRQVYVLLPKVEVESASMEHGMLTILLVRAQPEVRRIEIQTGPRPAGTIESQIYEKA